MKSLDLFLPHVNFTVLGVPEPTALQAIRFACVEFARRTDIVQRIQAPTDVVAGTQDYAVTVPADMRLGRVLGVAWQGRWLAPVGPDDVRSDVALRGDDVGSALALTGDPRFYFQKTPDAGSVSLYPIPGTALTGGILIKASFYPTFAANEVEDQLYDEWAESIASGAIAKLQGIPNQGFTANPLAATQRFEAAVAMARRQKSQGKMPMIARVMPKRFT